MKQFLKSLYLNNLFFVLVGANILIFILSFVYSILLVVGKLAFFMILVFLILDIFSLYRIKNGIEGVRKSANRFSNGDDNEVKIFLKSNYNVPVYVKVIDELPFQFQIRDFKFNLNLRQNITEVLEYSLRPVRRGEYHFGAVLVFVTGFIGFVSRRYRFSEEKIIEVYPSFLQMRKYELLAIAGKNTDIGVKKVRKVGHNLEFDQIKEYVIGDDIRTLNWKATARKGHLMVNQFQDEKAQQVYCIIDKGRTMKMPFDGMTLLDYSINASLVISNIALKKDDKAGLITYNTKVASFMPAEKRTGQISQILKALYREKTAFLESNNEILYSLIKTKVSHRSLLFLFSNFETVSSLQRQLKYFRKMSENHLLVVVFFENAELKGYLNKEVFTIEEIYLKTTAEKFYYEKKLIVKELQKYGILSIYTTPSSLSINVINKYLEIKARNLL